MLRNKGTVDKNELHTAVRNGDLRRVSELVLNGADPNAVDDFKETPLHVAAFCNFADIIQVLIKAGAFCEARRNDNEMPIHVAAMFGSTEAVDVFIKHSSKLLNVIGSEGRTPFIRAVINSKIDVLRVLLGVYKVDVNQINRHFGCSALHFAGKNNNCELVDLLVSYNADINILASNGFTPLQYCASQRNPSLEAAKRLIELGADVNAVNPRTLSPLELLERNENQDLPKVHEFRELLISHGAQVDRNSSNTRLTK